LLYGTTHRYWQIAPICTDVGNLEPVFQGPLCNCRHSLRADDEEALVEVALQHIKHHHPYASVEEERIRETISTRSYDIDYVVKYERGYGPKTEFDVERY
jgi:predicted small metal-binding protein